MSPAIDDGSNCLNCLADGGRQIFALFFGKAHRLSESFPVCRGHESILSQKSESIFVFSMKVCFNKRMKKEEAIALLGGSTRSVADQIGISVQAVYLWPEELTPALRDRVQAALYRREREEIAIQSSINPPSDAKPTSINCWE